MDQANNAQGVVTLEDYSLWKQNVLDLKEEQREMKDRVNELERRVGRVETDTLVNTRDIANIQQTLGDIKDDTKWLRRTFTGALITGAISGFIGLVIWLAQT